MLSEAITNDCSATGDLPFLVLAAYELRPRNGLPVRKTLVRQLLWLLFLYSLCGTYNQATPGLLNACVTVYDEFARN